MATNTTFNPPNNAAMIKTALAFNSVGMTAMISAGQTSNIDLVITKDTLFTGLWAIINSGNYGDHFTIQILDSNQNVLAQPITTFYVPPILNEQFDIMYPAKLISGLTLRLIYTSTGASDTFVAINYKLHEVLF
jgi:hypothetical protein